MIDLPPQGIILELEENFPGKSIYYNSDFLNGDKSNFVTRKVRYEELIDSAPDYHTVVDPLTFGPVMILGVRVKQFAVRIQINDDHVKVGWWQAMINIVPVPGFEPVSLEPIVDNDATNSEAVAV